MHIHACFPNARSPDCPSWAAAQTPPGPSEPTGPGTPESPLFILCQDLLCQQWAWAFPHAAINVIDILSISRKKKYEY